MNHNQVIIGSLFCLLSLLHFSVPGQVPDSLLAIPNDSSRALAIGQLAANTAFLEKDFDRAYLLLDRARQINQKIGSAFINAKLYREQGIIEQSRENSKEAIQAYQKAFDAFKKQKNEKMQVDALSRMEQIYFKDKEYETAERLIRQAIAILTQNPELPVYLLGDAYNSFASIQGELGNQKESLAYFEKARNAYQQAGEEEQVYITLLNSAITMRKVGLVDESVNRFKKVETYARSAKNNTLLLYVYLNLPNTLLQMGKNQEAIEYTQKALDVIQQNRMLNDYRSMETIYTNFHKTYAALDNYKEAYKYLQLASQSKDSLTGIEKKRELARLEAQFEAKQSQQQIQELGSENKTRQKQLIAVLAILSFILFFAAILLWQYRRLQLSKAKISEQSEQLKTLMKELHHRVKNNLAIVSSLLKLQ
ncbi:MAG: hypothetical protein KKG00_05100, partial [Bacteroidetes bacterium]|nr:hypothetical protein [Bacteroidota bacterium]